MKSKQINIFSIDISSKKERELRKKQKLLERIYNEENDIENKKNLKILYDNDEEIIDKWVKMTEDIIKESISKVHLDHDLFLKEHIENEILLSHEIKNRKKEFFEIKADDFFFFLHIKTKIFPHSKKLVEIVCLIALDYYERYRPDNTEKEHFLFFKNSINDCISKKLRYTLIKDYMKKPTTVESLRQLQIYDDEEIELRVFSDFTTSYQNHPPYTNKLLNAHNYEFSKFDLDKKTHIDKLSKEYIILKNKLEQKELLKDKIADLTELKKIKPFPKANIFPDSFWGDNYPSLKYYFNFLTEFRLITIGWSEFSEIMTEGNSDFLNLKTNEILSKSDIGYMLYIIMEFFRPAYNSTRSQYNIWLLKKITIDNSILEDSYINKYIRPYKKDQKAQKKFKSLNSLSSNLRKRHIK